MEIDDAINQYLAVDREAQIKLMGVEKANEGGRARTYNRNPANEIRRARAAAQANLGRRVIAGKINKDRARNQANKQRQKLYLGMANPYRPGPAPSQEVEYVKGPSTLGLVAGLAGAAVQGASTYNNFAPEGQQIGEALIMDSNYQGITSSTNTPPTSFQPHAYGKQIKEQNESLVKAIQSFNDGLNRNEAAAMANANRAGDDLKALGQLSGTLGKFFGEIQKKRLSDSVMRHRSCMSVVSTLRRI